MSDAFSEILFVLLLLVANGVFAMTEIAVVSARRGRLRVLAQGGDQRARAALELAESPNRFLSTVQIGITLVGICAGAFGGATIAETLAEKLKTVPFLAPYAEPLGLGVVVLCITYLSLVMGELVPKQVGLSNPERIAMLMTGPMNWLARVARPVVSFLSFSTDGLLRLLRVRPQPEAAVGEEEVKILLQEGLRAGAFNQVESAMVESVLALDRIPVRDIMTPRAKLLWLNRDDPHEAIWHKIVVSNRSHFPVYEGTRDQVVGIVSVKAIYANLAAGVGVKLADLTVKPLVVPVNQNVVQLLETFKQSARHIALVADEFGTIVGLVTLHDVMEAIVGDFPSPDERARPNAVRREDGSYLVDAMIELERLESVLSDVDFGRGPERDYQTLAGFVVKRLGHLPKEGETFEADGYVFEVLDMDRHRVDKVLVMRSPLPGGAAPSGTPASGSPAT